MIALLLLVTVCLKLCDVWNQKQEWTRLFRLPIYTRFTTCIIRELSSWNDTVASVGGDFLDSMLTQHITVDSPTNLLLHDNPQGYSDR